MPNGSRIDPYIAGKTRYSPYFNGCIGAIDGTHIAVRVPEEDHARYRDRSGHTTLNILAACNFNLEFIHVTSGWEGTAADSSVYEIARAQDLRVPPGKYLLGDSGFPTSIDLLLPYPGVRYHLKEWGHRVDRMCVGSGSCFTLLTD